MKDISSFDTYINDLYDLMTDEERILQLASFFPNGVKRLGIANMQQGECLHGVAADDATSFPQAIALGATFNPSLVEKVAAVIAEEARALGIHHCYTPMLGVARDIRWGRTEEAYGEDPCLVSEIGVAFINGLQGVGEERFSEKHVVATAKHFVADAEPLSGNNGASVDISERLLREVHLPPFEAAVKRANVSSVMPAHHALNGVPCHINKHILQEILRDEWGFEGILVSDNGDIRCLRNLMGTTDNLLEAAILSLSAGVDTELAWLCPMGKNRAYGPELLQACKDGKISSKVLELSVKRVLKMKQLLGLLDVKEVEVEEEYFEFMGDESGDEHIHYADTMRSFGIKSHDWVETLNRESTKELAKHAADQAIVLLKNENKLLPLSKEKHKKIAIIGPNADTRLLGGYSTKKPRYFVSVLDGIKNLVGNDCEIIHVEGCDPLGFVATDIDAAVSAAAVADVVILAVGGNEQTCKENQDVDTLDFVGDQSELVKRVYDANNNVVMVMFHGRPNSIEWESENIPAILECFYLGQECGNAVADTLFGIVNPGGKMPLSVPRNVGQCPAFYNKYPFGREQNYYESSHLPLYAFGHGISYTEFEIGLPIAQKNTFTADESNIISVSLKNIGAYDGDEVVQMYIHDTISSMVRPCKELKAFKRVTLKKGESTVVEFELTSEMLRFWKDDRFIVEPGEFKIMIGSNSVDTNDITVTLI